MLGVRDDDDVRLQQRPVPLDERPEVRRPLLLFAFHEHMHGHGQRPAREERTQRGEVHRDAGLVVGRPATVEAALALGGVEGRRRPEGEVADGLDVVVGVEEHDGRTRRPRAFGVDGRRGIRHLQQADALEAHVCQHAGGGLGCRAHRRRVRTLRADRGDAHQSFERGTRCGERRVDRQR